MKDTIAKLKYKIQEELKCQSEKELTLDGVRLDKALARAWLELDEIDKKLENSEYEFSEEDAECWNKGMINVDGSKGSHWTVDQTTPVASSVGVKFEHINASDWNVAMNMMWSDYYGVAQKYGIDSAGFYAELAKAFLFDPDGGKPYEKLGAYYNCIVKK